MTVRLVVILSLLLPLRVWAGDWMAIVMLEEQRQAAAAMPTDCPGHLTTDNTSDSGPGNCCDRCELCLPFTRTSVVVAALDGSAPSAVLPSGGTSFLSADLAPSRRPPRL